MKKLLVMLLVAFLACEGATGPAGPPGPQGPPGPAGAPGEPAIIAWDMAQVASDGVARITFAGLSVTEVVVSCWLSSSQDGPWIHVASDLEGVTCGVDDFGGDLLVTILDAPTGWWFLVTVASATG